jgi:hypothetical protein
MSGGTIPAFAWRDGKNGHNASQIPVSQLRIEPSTCQVQAQNIIARSVCSVIIITAKCFCHLKLFSGNITFQHPVALKCAPHL